MPLRKWDVSPLNDELICYTLETFIKSPGIPVSINPHGWLNIPRDQMCVYVLFYLVYNVVYLARKPHDHSKQHTWAYLCTLMIRLSDIKQGKFIERLGNTV